MTGVEPGAGEVPGDGVRAVVQTVLGESFSEPDDFVTDRGGGLVRGSHGPFRAGLESVVAAVVVEGDEFVDPGFGDAVVVGDGDDGNWAVRQRLKPDYALRSLNPVIKEQRDTTRRNGNEP